MGLKRTEALPVPVIVVGNWIVGGAGKTPTTLALLELLRARGLNAGVVSRGYGREGDGVRLISPHLAPPARWATSRCSSTCAASVPVAVGRDRVAAARALLAAHPGLDLLVSDDGLQHWRLPRALSLLVFDERGLGNGRLLPAGPLRQPPQKLAVGRPARRLQRAAAQHRPAGLRRQAAHLGRAPSRWPTGGPASPPPSTRCLPCAGKPGLLAVAGIARPQRFFDMLAGQGLEVDTLALPDHADFASAALATRTHRWPSC